MEREAKYSTFVMGSEHFTINPILENVSFRTEASEDMASYSIKAKINSETPFSEVLELIQLGMQITVTVDGKKRKLVLED